MGHETRSVRRLVPYGAAPGESGAPATGRPLASLEPRGVGAILDTALDVLRARFWACLLLAVTPSIPVQVLGRRIPQDDLGGDALVLMMVHVALTMGVQSLVVGLVCQVVYADLQGRVARLGEVLAAVLRRGLALVTLTVVTTVATALGTLCCFVPGLVIAWLLMVAPAALVLEGLGPRLAIVRSTRLMSKSFARWLGVMVTQTLLVLPLTLVAAGLSDPTAGDAVEQFLDWPPGLYEGASVALTSLVLGLVTAFAAVVMTVFYLDSRVRLEGFDLHMRFERLRARAAGGAPGGGGTR